MARTPDEISALRRDATGLLERARRVAQLRPGAERRRDALLVAIDDLIHRRAIVDGTDVDHLGLSDVLETDDGQALYRQFVAAVMDAAETPPVDEAETLGRVVARLAVERGWTDVDVARAILDKAGAAVDEVRDSPQRALAKRTRAAHRKRAASLMQRLDRWVDALDGDSAVAATPALLAAMALTRTGPDELTVERSIDVLLAVRNRIASSIGVPIRRSA